MRGAFVVCALAVVLAGCKADELHVGMVPVLQMSTPQGEPACDDYCGVSFGTHWDLAGIEVTTNASHRDAGTWTMIDGAKNLTTVAGSLWLGWHLTKGQFKDRMTGRNDDAKAWLVLRPSFGAYYWEEADNPVGLMLGVRAGVGIHINEFNTIGFEYGVTSLLSTHGNEESRAQGLHYTYSIVF